MNKRVTMADVARSAGVHVTTVSLALRNNPSLPTTTRERLQRLAEQMGYQPDPALSALVAYRRGARPKKDRPTLAYVTHWHTRLGWKDSPAQKEFFDGASHRASLLGYQIGHFWLGEPNLTHRRMSDILHSRGITGIIIASYRRDAADSLEFDWSRFSAVKIDYAPANPPLHLVTNDQTAIIRLAFQRVLAAGYRRVGFVMPDWWDQFVNLAWSAGFLTEQQSLRPEERIPILTYSSRGQEGNLQADLPGHTVHPSELKLWLRAYQPEVILSRDMFVMPSLERLGLKVPQDLGFVEIFLDKTDGRTAGVHENCRRVGEMAVEILVGQLQQNVFGIPAIPTATFVEGTWFDGESLQPRSGVFDGGQRVASPQKIPAKESALETTS